MSILFFLLIHLVLLLFYGLLGMTLLPESGRSVENRNAFFLISPLLGIGVWIAITVGLGIVLPYNALFLGTVFAIALFWIALRRESLFLPENPWICWLPFVIIVFSAIMSRGIAPTEIDGGLYFPSSVYDHVKCAIVNSISSHGLPPVNPWLADGGKTLPLVYYFGWHAWTAQLPILTRCSSLWAECAMTGFTFVVIVLGLCSSLTLFCRKKSYLACVSCLLILVIFDIEYTGVAEMMLPKSWMSVFDTEGISGFWNLYSNSIWSPQHLLAAAMVILILWVHDLLLHSQNAKSSACYAALLGLFAATALLTSVYSGAFALLMVAVLMIFDYCRNRDFRVKFNQALWWQISAVLLSLALTAFYLKFLFSYPPEENPLAVGMMPCFGEISHFWQYPLYFLQFYLCILPMRCGLIYVCGMLAIFWPGVLPKHPLVDFCKKYVVASLLLIFFVHSTFYSNDFGWRFPSAPNLLLAVFAAFFLCKVYGWIQCRAKKRWHAAVAVAPFAAVFFCVCVWEQYKNNYVPLKYDPDVHKAFARAVQGWKVVRAHTTEDDLVLCNPAGFYEIGKLYNSTESTSVFFSLYAQRNTPIADMIFAKCYSEFYPQDKLEKLHGRIVSIFNGNPSKDDADYLAEELKVRAILVTPLDGLWQKTGEIEIRFPMKEENEDYRVYWREN